MFTVRNVVIFVYGCIKFLYSRRDLFLFSVVEVFIDYSSHQKSDIMWLSENRTVISVVKDQRVLTFSSLDTII